MLNMIRSSIAWLLVVVMAASVVLSGCAASGEDEASAEDKINIVTTIAQIADPLSIIGGDKVQITSLMGPGVDPHLYNATQGDIQKLENSDAVFYSGLHLEANLVKVFAEIGKGKTVLALGEAIPKEKLLKDKGGAIDPHIWFDIDLWKQGIEAATEELKKMSEEDAAYFEENKINYFAELDKLKLESKEKLTRIPEEQRILVTAHDAFGYFGRLQNLRVIGLQGLSTEAEIGLSNIDDTINLLVQYKVPAVFVETSINPASIQAVIEGAKKQNLDVTLGGELYSDAMGDSGTPEGTYIGMYRHNVDTIYEALMGEVR